MFLFFFLRRSAPASPSHVNMSGTLTPDSLSREGSPVPDGAQQELISEQVPQVTVVAQQQPQFATPRTIPHDVRYSQSAPGSPSGKHACTLWPQEWL